MKSKAIHKHSLPIIILAVALFSGSLVALNHVSDVNGMTAVRHGLVMHVLTVKPSDDGLARIALVSQKPSTAPTVTSLQMIVLSSGEVAELSVN